jgi:hypothetical protein
MLICGRLFDGGPRFSLPGDNLPVRQPAPGRDSIMVPGGAPPPPECFRCVQKPAGAAPRPAVTNASRERPSEGRGAAILTEVRETGITRRESVIPAKAGIREPRHSPCGPGPRLSPG